MFTISV